MESKRLEHIDKMANEALGQMEVPYQSMDWAAMEARIDKDAFLKTRLYWLKGGELLVMLLAFWLLIQFSGWHIPGVDFNAPNHSTTPSVKKENTPLKQQSTSPAVIPGEQAPAESEKTDVKQELQENAKKAKGLPFASNKHKTPKNRPLRNAFTQAEATHTATAANAFSPFSSKPRTGVPIFEENSVIQAPTFLTPPENNSVITPIQTSPDKIASYDDGAIERLPVSLTLLDNKLTGDLLLNADLPQRVVDPVPTGLKKPRHLRIAASADMNMTDGSYRMGMTGSGLVGVELSDKWKIESGLSYSAKTFKELPMNEAQYPNLADTYTKDMNWHVMSIPLHLQYTIKQSTNWRPFINMGASVHAVMSASYAYQNSMNTVESLFDQDREAGLLQGGNLNDNVYYTADFGLGLERQLDKNLHLFIQPTYKYALNNAGIHRDRVHTFSLVMGARTTL